MNDAIRSRGLLLAAASAGALLVAASGAVAQEQPETTTQEATTLGEVVVTDVPLSFHPAATRVLGLVIRPRFLAQLEAGVFRPESG